jgi:hypothetical protein
MTRGPPPLASRSPLHADGVTPADHDNGVATADPAQGVAAATCALIATRMQGLHLLLNGVQAPQDGIQHVFDHAPQTNAELRAHEGKSGTRVSGYQIATGQG